MMTNRIDAIGHAITQLVSRLTDQGFIFDRPDEVLPGVEPGTDEAIERIESEIGIIPLATKLFWLRVGSVDLSGSHPNWEGCEYPDPLIVFPPSSAIYELEDFLADREERLSMGLPYLVPVAPDFYHKADVSGGMWYNVAVPAVADDPPLNDEWHNVTFLAYLEIALRFGGFPGLSRCSSHTWPIERLSNEPAG